MKWENALFIAVLAFVLGYILGRSNGEKQAKIVVKTETKYETLPAIHDTIFQPVPFNQYYVDTVLAYIPVDTAAILADYFLTREYNLDLGNDTLGEFRINAKVTQNKLYETRTTIKPVIKTILTTKEKTVYQIPTLQFYGMIGSNLDLSAIKVQAGIDIKQKYMLGLSGVRFDNSYNYTIDVGIKF